jgi:hypothetical protein
MKKITKLTEESVQQILDWIYEKAINGVPGIESAQKLADTFINSERSQKKMASDLINWQILKTTTSGFLTGLGDLILLPFTLPVSFTSVTFIQMRMIVAIAIIGGYDPHDDRVKTLVYACLTGASLKDLLKGAGISLSAKLSKSAINSISRQTLTVINQRVGFRFITKFGEKGIVNLGKLIPIAGGLVGGTLDGVSTKSLGQLASKVFLTEDSSSKSSKQSKGVTP